MNPISVTYAKGRYNPAGITKVYFALPEDIATFPVLDTPDTVGATFSTLVTLPGAIVMAVGKKFQEIYCTLEEGELKSTFAGNRDGKGKENMLEISFPGNDADYLGFEAYAANRDFVFLVKEKNGKYRVLGSPEDPAYLDTGDATSGKKIADGRKNVLTFKASGATAPPIYTTAVASLLINQPAP
jgi:hypothetical protein